MKLAFASLLLPTVAAWDLAGFDLTSDVQEHSKIDLDLVEINDALISGNKTLAQILYDDGAGNSMKSGNRVRSIGGFWNIGKKTGEFDYSLQRGAGYDESWGDDYVTTSIQSDVVPTSSTVDAMKYIVIKAYVMHELIDAVGDYAAAAQDDNDAGVKAWDEGWAFYVGSAASHLLYSDTTTGVQDAVRAEYEAGAAILAQATSPSNVVNLWKHVYKIHELMNFSSILKMFEHASAESPVTESVKVFANLIYSELKACDSDAAAILKANAFDYSVEDGFMKDGFAAGVATPVLNNMECFHLSAHCQEIPSQYGSCAVYVPDSEGKSETIAGYVPGSDVHQHNRVDVDLLRMGQFVNAGDWAGAEKIYQKGWNSLKSSGVRNLQGFSKGISTKQDQVPQFPDYMSYWGGEREFSDKYITSLLSGDKKETDSTPRKEMIFKSIVSENIFMYTLREFYDAIEDCEASDITDNDDGVHAWDEGVAFYTGSLIGTEADSTASTGKSLYTLANKRCGNFGTCDVDTGNSNVNKALFVHFNEGRDSLSAGQCAAAKDLMPTIYKLMLVPPMQGMLRYAYKADPNGKGDGTKSFSEGWAFARAVLPAISKCTSAANVKKITDNMDFFGNLGQVSGGYAEVYRAAEAAYECLGITCDDIGDLTVSGGGCTDSCPAATTCQFVEAGDDDSSDSLDGAASGKSLSFGAAILASVAGFFFAAF